MHNRKYYWRIWYFVGLNLLENNNLVKKKFLKPVDNLIAKIIISNKSNMPICRNKYDLDSYLGAFTIKLHNK